MFDFKSFTENLGATLSALTPKVTVPFGVAAWLLLYIHKSGLMPLQPPVIVSALVVGVLCTCLAITSVFAALWTATQPLRGRLALVFVLRRERKRIESELEFLQPKERQIIGCLLATRQKMVEVLPDGEEARTLLAKGFLVQSSRQPRLVHRDICVEVPNHVWEVLIKHREKFPFDETSEPQNPWRTHWMAR